MVSRVVEGDAEGRAVMVGVGEWLSGGGMGLRVRVWKAWWFIWVGLDAW